MLRPHLPFAKDVTECFDTCYKTADKSFSCTGVVQNLAVLSSVLGSSCLLSFGCDMKCKTWPNYFLFVQWCLSYVLKMLQLKWFVLKASSDSLQFIFLSPVRGLCSAPKGQGAQSKHCCRKSSTSPWVLWQLSWSVSEIILKLHL